MADGIPTQPDSKSEDSDVFQCALTRFGYCVDAEGINRNFQRDDMRFYAGSPDNGWQWPDKVLSLRQNDPNGARPCLTINKLPEHVHQITNEQRQNRPSIKVLPVDDKADLEMAEKFNGIIRHIEYVSDADVAYDTACERQVVHGEGYARVQAEWIQGTMEQELLIRRIRNSFTVHIDPEAQDPTAADAKYGFIDEIMTESEFHQQYPGRDAISWENQGQDEWYANWFLTGEKKVRVADYYYVDYEKVNLHIYADGTITNDESRKNGLGVVEMPKRSRVENKRIIKYCKLYGGGILEEEVWFGTLFPIVRVIGNEFDVDGQLLFTGLVRNAKDAQRMYNYWTSQEAEMLALAPKAPFVGAAGQFENFEIKWDQANIKNFSYLEYNPVLEGGQLVPPPQRVMPPMPSAGILQAKAGMSEDIKSTTGQYDASLGIRKGNQSGVAQRQLIQEGDVANFHYSDNFARFIRQIGRILVEGIPKIYDTRRIARILGEDQEPDQVIIDPRIQTAVQPVMQMNPQTRQLEEIARLYNPNVGRYDVIVRAGPSYSTKRQEAAAMMGEAFQANPALWNVVGDLYVKNQDWPGADEFAKRLRLVQDPRVLQEDGKQGMSPESQQAMEQAHQAMLLVEKKAQELQEVENKLMSDAAQTTAEKAQLESARSQLQAEKRVLDADFGMRKAQIDKLIEQLSTQRQLLSMERSMQRPEQVN